MLACGLQMLLFGLYTCSKALILLLLVLFLSGPATVRTLLQLFSQLLEVFFIYNQWREPESNVTFLTLSVQHFVCPSLSYCFTQLPLFLPFLNEMQFLTRSSELRAPRWSQKMPYWSPFFPQTCSSRGTHFDWYFILTGRVKQEEGVKVISTGAFFLFAVFLCGQQAYECIVLHEWAIPSYILSAGRTHLKIKNAYFPPAWRVSYLSS